MTATPNPFEAMMAMGRDWARAMIPALEHFMPKGFGVLLPTMLTDHFVGRGLGARVFDTKIKFLGNGECQEAAVAHNLGIDGPDR
ncbi:MAG: hypothetical protein AAF566_03670 [Pseudomonadota bacterium]